MPGAARMKSNMLARRVGIALRSSGPIAGPEPGIPRVGARIRLDDDRFRDARQLQDDDLLDGASGLNLERLDPWWA